MDNKEYAMKLVHDIRKKQEDMKNNRPQLRDLNREKYDYYISVWNQEYNELEKSKVEIINNWAKGIIFIQ